MPANFVIVGLQRTGTTWIRTTLDAHDSIRALGEVFLFSHAGMPIRRTTGYDVAGSYGNYIEQGWRRKLRHLVDRQAIVEQYLNELLAGNDSMAVGFKLMRNQARQFPMVVPYVRKHALRVIHVERSNVLKTYVSRKTAKQRKLFHARQAVAVRRISLDTSRLVAELARISRDNEEWERELSDGPYIKVTYESFVRNMEVELSRIFSFLEIPPSAGAISPLTKINPDSLYDIVENYADVERLLRNTPFEWCLAERDGSLSAA